MIDIATDLTIFLINTLLILRVIYSKNIEYTTMIVTGYFTYGHIQYWYNFLGL